ncbi:MAG: cardiolipin synthase [Chthoniobacter sp.]|nr:cardiolipin synthase [Chthoniobacter sp.]
MTSPTLLSILVFAVEVAGCLTAVKAIMETRTAQGAIAWAVSLVTLPWIAVPAYWIFGRTKFAGYVTARRAEVLKTSAVARKLAEEFDRQRLQTKAGRQEELLLERLAKLPFTAHNRATLLIDGEATFGAIFAAIAAAREYVLVQFYIIRDDGLGRRLRDALIERSRAGVRCYVLFDEVGSGRLRRYCALLRAAGVQIAPFNTTKGPANRFQINFRNHRKIVIVDGLIGFVGGHNVGDEYLGLDATIGPWRDTHVQVEGPVVQCVQVAWLEDWLWATGDTPANLNWKPIGARGGCVGALCLPSGPADDLETATLFFLHAIHSATKRLWIATPYFVPDEQFVSSLQLAALRGVDVRILIPETPDNALVRLSGFSYLRETESVGIKWFRHQRGFMHQKVMLVDDDYCAIGTANFDNRSFRLNFEITMVFYEHAFAQQVADMLTRDFSESTPATAHEHDRASFWFRLRVRIARLMAPVQ